MKAVSPIKMDLKCNIDDRGFLYQIFGGYEDKFPEVKRIYIVGNFCKGVIRGFHKHLIEWKCYFVITGSAKFIVLDKDNNKLSYVLSSKSPSILIVPPDFAHGWISLEDGTILAGLSNRSLEESIKDDIRSDPLSFGTDIWSVIPR